MSEVIKKGGPIYVGSYMREQALENRVKELEADLAAARADYARLAGDYSEEAGYLRTRAEKAEAELAALRADVALVDDLAHLVRRLARANVDEKLRADVLDYLSQKGLTSSIMRGDAVRRAGE